MAKKATTRRGRETLTREAIVRAAARLIDAEGEGVFSMRRLGEAMGVEAMAFYNHFADKDAILDAVAEHVFGMIGVPRGAGAWQKRIKDLCVAVRELAKVHPQLFRLAMTRPSKPASALPLMEVALAALAEGGLSAEQRANGYHTLVMFIRGFCLWEIENMCGQRESALAQVEARLEAFPRTVESARWIFTPGLDGQFEAGLETILRGMGGKGRPRLSR